MTHPSDLPKRADAAASLQAGTGPLCCFVRSDSRSFMKLCSCASCRADKGSDRLMCQLAQPVCYANTGLNSKYVCDDETVVWHRQAKRMVTSVVMLERHFSKLTATMAVRKLA